MAKRLAWLLLAACLILTACNTTSTQKKETVPQSATTVKEQPKKDKGKAKAKEQEKDEEKEQEQQSAETGIKFTKIHVPLTETKKENGHMTSRSVYTYGQDKLNPERVETYDVHNELIELVVIEKIEVRTERKSYLDKDNNIIRYYVITRNENGKIEEQLLFNGSNKLIAIEEYDYDEAGRTAEWRIYNGSETLLSYNVYTYKNGRNTRVDSYSANGILAQYFINEYDKNGNLTCESAYDKDDNLLAQHRSTFRNGLIYREEFQGEDKKLQWYINYTYSEQYLKVLKTTYSGDGRELEQVEQSCLLFDR
ncbi:MAG: hypothetical protein IKO95_00730 [Spirochaetia bacterium]|jgi:hypothetical protein|nr:hypothetical protein [Spirochaetia bacterium]